MLKKLLLPIFFSASLFSACPAIDPSKTDSDGMPLCPDGVAERSAWIVFSCALDQAKSFHPPTAQEKKDMSSLLEAWRDSNVQVMRAAADNLNLQACRVKDKNGDAPNSSLLFYTKPKVNNYSGPFLILKEGKRSKVLVVGPHDDSDGTYADTKFATQKTSAMATISNGHKRGNVRGKDNPSKNDDFVHSNGPDSNLGTYAVKKVCDIYKVSVVLHIHGMKDPHKVLYRARDNKILEDAWEKAIKNNTNITEFAALNADFSIDRVVNTNWYVKAEMPARIHMNNKMALANIVREIETYTWAWEDTK